MDRAAPYIGAMIDVPHRARAARRLRRQIEAIGRAAPSTRPWISALLNGRLRYVRLPAGILLVAAGLVGFLPIVGFWMIPLGLLILAVDIPALRPAIAALVVRLRRRMRLTLGRAGRFAWLGRKLGRHQ